MRILRERAEAAGLRTNYNIYDSGDQVTLVRDLLRDIRGDVAAVKPEVVHAEISRAKSDFELPEDVLDRRPTHSSSSSRWCTRGTAKGCVS